MHQSLRTVVARRVLVVFSAALIAAVLNAGGASADGPVQLRSRLGDACLDAPSADWFTFAVVNPCNGTDFSAGMSPATGDSNARRSPGKA